MSKNWGRADHVFRHLFFLYIVSYYIIIWEVISDMLKGKKILLCVTGGIAVYKAAALTSKLLKQEQR